MDSINYKPVAKKRGCSNLVKSKTSAFQTPAQFTDETYSISSESESESESNNLLKKRIKTLEDKLSILNTTNLSDIVNKVNMLITQQINNYQLFIKEKSEADNCVKNIIRRIESLEQRLVITSESQKKINDNFDFRINGLLLSTISNAQQESSSNLQVSLPQIHTQPIQLQSGIEDISKNEITKIINEINKNVYENKKILLRIEDNYKKSSENITNNKVILEKINANICKVVK